MLREKTKKGSVTLSEGQYQNSKTKTGGTD